MLIAGHTAYGMKNVGGTNRCTKSYEKRRNNRLLDAMLKKQREAAQRYNRPLWERREHNIHIIGNGPFANNQPINNLPGRLYPGAQLRANIRVQFINP